MKRALVVAVLAGMGAWAGDPVEVWNGVETTLVEREKTTLRLRGEVRSADAFRRFLTTRAIVDGRRVVKPHLAVIGQYQAVESRIEKNWEEYNRATGGVEVPWQSGEVTMSARAAAEYFWRPNQKDYQRHRERVTGRWAGRPMKPLLGLETIWDGDGWATTRTMTGALVPMGQWVTLDTGYYYEWRPERLGGNRHVIYTFFKVRRPKG